MTEAAPTEASGKTERDNGLRKAYQAATTRLRDEHRDEFTTLYTEEAAKLGIDYKPRPSKAEKAEADLAALIEANPELEERIVANIRAKVEAEMAAKTPGYETAPPSTVQ